MKLKAFLTLSVAATLGFGGLAVIAADPQGEAKALFQKYVELGNAFDPSIANLYADDAKIVNTRYYPNGQTKTLSFPAPAYKQMIVTSMPLAKAKNDQDSSSKVTYEDQKGSTKITALRHNKLKNYDSWLVLVVSKTPGGIKITQEHSQSRP